MVKTTGVIDWEEVGKTTNLAEVIRFLPPEIVIETLATKGEQQLLNAVLTCIPRDRLLEMLKQAEPQEKSPAPAADQPSSE